MFRLKSFKFVKLDLRVLFGLYIYIYILSNSIIWERMMSLNSGLKSQENDPYYATIPYATIMVGGPSIL
jgi:hypothetical protein